MKKYSYSIIVMEFVCINIYIFVIYQLFLILLKGIGKKGLIIFNIIILVIIIISVIAKVHKIIFLKKYGVLMEGYIYEDCLNNISAPILFSPFKASRVSLEGKVKTPYGFLPIKVKVRLGVYQSFLYSEIIKLEDNIKIPMTKVLIDTKHYKVYHIYAYDFLNELYEVNIGGKI